MKQIEYRRILFDCVRNMLDVLDVLMEDIEYEWSNEIRQGDFCFVKYGKKDDGEVFIRFNGEDFNIDKVYSEDFVEYFLKDKYSNFTEGIEFAISVWPAIKDSIAKEKMKWTIAKEFRAD